ncbi:peroxidase [Nocardioides silvaticus]|uniref:Peroxidase n=1 Tax=Nocardioides silvaticus TaxID=2201891 RepID=A0A316TMY4_9ACTN|nr:carboxymuconolactone decarboxylase family protein [Nocardioides silvaticus]PWN05021.1 peroxidase [Nocardioides silvaticus]
MARMAPIPPEDCTDPELGEAFQHFVRTLGFVPNSLLTMQRVPAIAAAVIQLNRAVFAPDGEVDLGLKRLVGHLASAASGCQYCKAHTTVSATRHGVSAEKMEAVYDYATSPHFTPAERVALDFALAAASVPNAVTDEIYRALAEHWTETQIVEILGVVCMFGVFNRWNDSMATPLEDVPLSLAGELLGSRGWEAGKHAPGG